LFFNLFIKNILYIKSKYNFTLVTSRLKRVINMSKFIADILYLLHYLLIPFLFVFTFVGPIKYIPIFIIGLIFMFYDWADRDQSCFWSKINSFLYNEKIDTNSWADNSNGLLNKTAMFLNNLFCRENTEINIINIKREMYNFLIFALFLISFYRVSKHYKIVVISNIYVKIIISIILFLYIFATFLLNDDATLISCK